MTKLRCRSKSSTQRAWHWPAPFCPCGTGLGVIWPFCKFSFRRWLSQMNSCCGKGQTQNGRRKKQNTGQIGAGVSEPQREGCGRVFYTYPQEWSCTHPLTHLTLRSIMSFSYLESDIAVGFERMICKCSQSHLIRAPASLYQLSNKADGFGQQTCR